MRLFQPMPLNRTEFRTLEIVLGDTVSSIKRVPKKGPVSQMILLHCDIFASSIL